MKIRLLLLLIVSACAGNTQKEPDTNELIGIWQSAPVMASGWSDTYQFFENGTFIFNYNQMICDKRTINYSGTWQLNSDKLKLITTEETVVEGGKLIPAMGSCASAYEIEEGEIKKIKLKEPKPYEIEFPEIIIDKENRDLKQGQFDGKIFWKFNDDPTQY